MKYISNAFSPKMLNPKHSINLDLKRSSFEEIQQEKDELISSIGHQNIADYLEIEKNGGESENVESFLKAYDVCAVGIVGDREVVYEKINKRVDIMLSMGLEEEVKSLSRAAHADYLRGSNSFATGMSLTLFGSILLIIAFVFFLLSFKADAGGNLVTTCAEFIVCIALGIISVILLGAGIYLVVRGLVTKRRCSLLLKDINNQTFVQ